MAVTIDLAGHRALVTGGGQGVGRGIARMLAAAGAEVLVNDLVPERTEAVADEITAEGGRAVALPFDVTDYQAVRAATEAVAPPDILVNNAGNAGAPDLVGSFDLALFVDTDPATWDRFVRVNFYGVLNCVHAFLPGMIEGEWGRIVTVISDSARAGDPRTAVYAGAKAAAAGFMRSIASEAGRHGITANCVSLATMNPIPPEARIAALGRGRGRCSRTCSSSTSCAAAASPRTSRAWSPTSRAPWRRGSPGRPSRSTAATRCHSDRPDAFWRPRVRALRVPTAPKRSRKAACRYDHRCMETVDDVRDALAEHQYLADEGLATAIFLALRLKRPLLLEGEAGVGKTEVAKVLSRWTGGELVRLQCYEGIDAAQAVYEWDYSRQLLHLRAVEAAGEEVVEDELYSERFLVKRPLLRAIGYETEALGHVPPPVLLVDEVDRADDEFEAFLLEILSDYTITVPELGTFRAAEPPVVIVTSNRTRDVHDALKRRCLYHWIAHPDFDRELAILRVRAPDVPEVLARQVAAAVESLRELELYKPPGVAETIDWANALAALGSTEIDERTVDATLGTILKYREDQERTRAHGIGELVGAAVGRSA